MLGEGQEYKGQGKLRIGLELSPPPSHVQLDVRYPSNQFERQIRRERVPESDLLSISIA